MGRPSKLTPAQWDEIKRRVAAGETIRSLAREFGVGESSIRDRGISAQTAQVRAVAEKLAAAHTELATLPIPQQHLAVQLADELREISTHLAAAARYGSATAHRLAAVAHAKVQELDDSAPLGESADALRDVAVLTKVANDSAQVGLNLLKANEDTIREINAAAQKRASRITRIEIVPMTPLDGPT